MSAPGRGLAVEVGQEGPVPLDAAFSCAPGEVLALVGPSGAGKTSLLRAVAGTIRPERGRIAVDGTVWLDSRAGLFVPPHRRRVGLVFQSYALFPHMTALDNVMAALGHLAPGAREARGRALLELVHLGGLEERRPAELSGGQQQRVAVARALAREPEVLLLDEPFSAVDRATRERLYREIAALRQQLDMPVVLVTHDLDEATMLADRMAVLDEGRILQQGAPEEIALRPASARVARLLDMRNVFAGRVVGHEKDFTLLNWRGLRLEARRAPDWQAGAEVSWVVPDGFVVLHRRERPSRGERENPVRGRVETMVVIGQMAQIALRPAHAPEPPLHFSVPVHVARRNAIAPGVEAAVSLLAEGIHLMPRAP